MDFPCSHFQCIDSSAVDINKINFLPRSNASGISKPADTGCQIRDYALKSYSRDKFQMLDYCSENEYFEAPPAYIRKKAPVISVNQQKIGYRTMQKVINSLEYWLWKDQRFAIHMRNYIKGWTNLDLVDEFDAKYILKCMQYLIFEALN